MKKYITVAALLAAGTAFANALTLVGSYTDSTVSGGVETWALGATFVPSTETNYAVIYTLDVDAFSAALTGGSLSGTQIVGINSANYGFGLRDNNVLALGTNGAGNELTSFYSLSPTKTASTSWLTNGDATLVGAAIVFSTGISFSGTTTAGAAGFSFVYSDGSTADYIGTNSGFRSSSTSFSQALAVDGLVSSVSVFSGTPTEVSTVDVLATAAQSVIPEPSAFGLLAGVGALALVAVRRRRSK